MAPRKDQAPIRHLASWVNAADCEPLPLEHPPSIHLHVDRPPCYFCKNWNQRAGLLGNIPPILCNRGRHSEAQTGPKPAIIGTKFVALMARCPHF